MLPYLLLFSIPGVISYLYVNLKSNEIEIFITIRPKNNTDVQVYYDTGSGFNEREKRQKAISANQANDLRFSIPKASKRLRLDPASNITEVEIFSLSIRRGLSSQKESLIPDCIGLIRHAKIMPRSDAIMELKADNNDPQILISRQCLSKNSTGSIDTQIILETVLAVVVVLSLISFAFIKIVVLSKNRQMIRYLFMAIGIIIFQSLLIVMLSKYNLHPDEHSHTIASQFYKKHWFKLRVDHPDMKNSLIAGWTISYLHLNDIVYFLAEKTTTFLHIWIDADFKRYRLFNFSLFIALILIFVSNLRKGIYFLLAIGLTPQLWYVFSYFNGDALSLFACLILGYYFIYQRSRLELFFWSRQNINWIVVQFYFLCTLVMFTRLNYVIFVFFILGLVFLLKPKFVDLKETTSAFFKLSLFALSILMLVGVIKIYDSSVNDFRKSELIAGIQSEMMPDRFSKKHILEGGDNRHLLFLRDLGIPFSNLITEYNWMGKSIQSFLGTYGYMKIWSSQFFYFLSGLAGLGSVALLILGSAFQSNRQYTLIVMYSLLVVIAIIIQSMLNSWIFGFQPQGRYLLAIIPLLAVTLSLNPIKIPVFIIYRLMLVIYMINIIGFTIYGILPMLNV